MNPITSVQWCNNFEYLKMIAFVLKISAPVKCTQKIIFFSKPAHPAEAAACFQQIPLLSESFINLF
jgi:hypothetical protein